MNGQIQSEYSGPGLDVFNMMIERAKLTIVPQLLEKEQQKIQAPSPEMTLALGK